MIFNLIVVLTLSILVTMFAVSNSAAVSVNLILWQTQQVSLAIVILVSVLIGVMFTGVIALYTKISDSMKIFRLESKLREYDGMTSEQQNQQG